MNQTDSIIKNRMPETPPGSHISEAPPSNDIEVLNCLYQVTRALSATLDLKAALKEVMDILAHTMGMKRGTVTILKPYSTELQIEVAHGLTAEARKRGRYRLGEGITGRVVSTGEPLVVPKIAEDPRFLNKTRTRSGTKNSETGFICVPIKDGSRTIGALSVDKLFSGKGALEDDLQLLTVISSLISQSVVRLQAAHAEREALLAENRKLKRALSEKYEIKNIIGKSGRMQEVFDLVLRVAESNATVLLRGESGTGKSLIAKAIHFNCSRRKGPFVIVNCSAIPESLIESELFGHERGAFTGAVSRKSGKFEQAKGGTIFLDEIGELPHHVQVKLLNVIQDKEFQPLGSSRTIKADVRIIAATNRNLEEAMESGHFREDLYYRLNVFPVYLPPLRDRRTDIPLLAEHFMKKFARDNNKNIVRISQPAIDALLQFQWPGNVRELQNCMERAVLICDEEVLRIHHLPPSLQFHDMSDQEVGNAKKSLTDMVAHFEKELIVEALSETGGNQTKAAKQLDTSLRIINYKIKKYGIDATSFKKKV